MARIVVSLLIVWHFSAVFLAALSIQPASRLVTDVAQGPPMGWYLNLLYLNHGHSFFAPNVGPGHVLRYELFDASGRVIAAKELPDTKNHRPKPRLRYHRHLMLADQADYPSPDQEESERWQRKFLEAYARHLLRVNQEAQTVRVRRYLHWPLPREFAVQGEKIDDPRSYELLTEVTQHRRDVEPRPADRTGGRWDDGRREAANPWIGAPR